MDMLACLATAGRSSREWTSKIDEVDLKVVTTVQHRDQCIDSIFMC